MAEIGIQQWSKLAVRHEIEVARWYALKLIVRVIILWAVYSYGEAAYEAKSRFHFGINQLSVWLPQRISRNLFLCLPTKIGCLNSHNDSDAYLT
jgi:hypothetical protein